MRYGWPGNVRQMAGVLFRAALQCDGSSLTAEHFPHIAVQSRFTGRRTDVTADSEPGAERAGDRRRSGRDALFGGRSSAPARGDRSRPHSAGDRPLSRSHERGRSAAGDRPFDPLPKTRRPRDRYRSLEASTAGRYKRGHEVQRQIRPYHRHGVRNCGLPTAHSFRSLREVRSRSDRSLSSPSLASWTSART